MCALLPRTPWLKLQKPGPDQSAALRNRCPFVLSLQYENRENTSVIGIYDFGRMQQLVACYNHLEIAPDLMPGTYCNGTVTLEENIADLGGVNIALDAYTEYLLEKGFAGSALQDQQKKFFESYADLWCCLYGQEYIDSRITGKNPDKHALPRERVNGIVMNIDLWYTLYGVNRNNMLYLPPERRARIW